MDTRAGAVACSAGQPAGARSARPIYAAADRRLPRRYDLEDAANIPCG